MKKLLLPILVIILSTFSFSQEVKKDDWIRVQSDDGEFSIELPSNYKYFYDEKGFYVGKDSNIYPLEQMNMFSAYLDDSSISFECYKGTKDALDAIKHLDDRGTKSKGESTSSTEIKRDENKIKQKIFQNENHFTVRQYLYSKTHLYILTTSSRAAETKTTMRFLNSLVFTPNTKNRQIIKDAIFFSKLVSYKIDLKEALDTPISTEKSPVVGSQAQPQTISNSFVISKNPLPTFTEEGRTFSEQGVVRLRIVFSKEGIVSGITILKSLKHGLLRQAIFAAIRIKFLPKLESGSPIDITKTLEYAFRIY